MKNKILTILIGLSLNSFGQNQMLFDNMWILEDLILDNISYVPPNNQEVANVTLEFDSFSHESIEYMHLFGFICETISGPIEFNDIDNFSFSELPYETLGGGCNETQNSTYENIYFSFFYDGYNNNNIFNYTITINSDNSKTLVVTTQNGDQAIYNSQSLTIKDNIHQNVSLNYNPENKSIYLNSNNDSDIFLIKLFNIQGELIIEKHIRNSNPINIKNLSNGLYFIIGENQNGLVIKKKLLKF